MSNDRTSDNTPLKQAELPPAQRHTAVTDIQSATGASEFIPTLTHAPPGEPLVTERSKELIRDIDL